MISPHSTLRIVLAFPAAILGGLLLGDMWRALYDALRPYYAAGGLVHSIAFLAGYTPWLAAAVIGFLVSLLAGPRARGTFILWPFLILGGMCASECLVRDPWLEPELTLLGYTLLIYPALVGSLMPALWYWRRTFQDNPSSLHDRRSVLYLVLLSLIAGVGLYCWGRLFVMSLYESDDEVAIYYLLFTLFTPITVAWASFLISLAAGAARVVYFVLWPTLVMVGLGASSLIDLLPAMGSEKCVSGDILLLYSIVLFVAGIFGSACTTVFYCNWSSSPPQISPS